MGIAIGEMHKTHGYIARVPLGNNKYRYFYTTQELAAYKAHRRKSKDEKHLGIMDKEKKKKADDTYYIAEVKKDKKKGKKNSTDKKSAVSKKASNLPNHRRELHPTNSVGKLISGYKAGGGKPKNISDADWERYQRLWNTKIRGTPQTSNTGLSSANRDIPKKKKKKSNSNATVTKKITTTSGLISVRRK